MAERACYYSMETGNGMNLHKVYFRVRERALPQDERKMGCAPTALRCKSKIH
jgi:hypothetical protein